MQIRFKIAQVGYYTYLQFADGCVKASDVLSVTAKSAAGSPVVCAVVTAHDGSPPSSFNFTIDPTHPVMGQE